MLTADDIERIGNTAQAIIDPVTDFLIREIARRISDAGQLTSSASYQVWKAQTLGVSQEFIKKRLGEMLDKAESEIAALLTQSADVGYNYDLSRLPTADAIPFAKNEDLQAVLSATIAGQKESMSNLTQTTAIGFIGQSKQFYPITQAFESACDYAFSKSSTGAQAWQEAVKDAISGLSDRGIVQISYDSGKKIEMGAAVRLNVMGGMGLLQERISKNVHDTMGADGWEISAHAASAPDHEPIQGKQYTDAAYEAIENSLVRRIGTLNCGHSAHPIIMGVSQPQYSEAQLSEMRKANEKGITYQGKHYTTYEATQQQRAIERRIRALKRKRSAYSAAGLDVSAYDSKLRIINSEYKRFSAAAGLVEQRQRLWTR